MMIQEIPQQYIEQAVSFRRHLHQHPELSFQEFKTADWICATLNRYAVPYRKGIGGNGIVATLKGQNPEHRTIALRADFDALPIQEETDLAFKSINKGVMHACGHDLHTANLLAVLAFLNDHQHLFKGTIHFVFQHAEELLPGGANGMLQDDLFLGDEPEVMIAQHSEPALTAGTFGFKAGAYMASNDEVYIQIQGKGGHAAMPHTINDTVLAASQTVVNLQQIASRKTNPTVPMVLSIGKMEAEGATNVIPDVVKMAGTFRTFDEAWRKEANRLIEEIAHHTAKAHGCKALVDIKRGYPVVTNDPNVTDKAIGVAQTLFGKSAVFALEHRMTSEDFGFFTQKYPSVFYRFGVGFADKEKNFPLHSSKFNPNEEALKYSVKMMVNLALKMLV